MGSTHRRRRSTLAVVVIVTAVVGVRLTGAGAVPEATPLAGAPTATGPARTATPIPSIPAVSTPAVSTPAASRSAGPILTPSTPTPAASTPATPTPLASSPAASPGVSSPAACGADDVHAGALAAVGDADSALVAGSPVRFTLTVTSSAGSACAVTPVLSVTITSGKDRIWTSADCPIAGVGGPGTSPAPTLSGTAEALLVPGGALLGAGATATFDLIWPGVRSTGSCTASVAALRAGTYVATAEIADVGTVGSAFQLR